MESELTAAHPVGWGLLIFSHVGEYSDAHSLHFAFGPPIFTSMIKIMTMV